jgi:hypothetical protein
VDDFRGTRKTDGKVPKNNQTNFSTTSPSSNFWTQVLLLKKGGERIDDIRGTRKTDEVVYQHKSAKHTITISIYIVTNCG